MSEYRQKTIYITGQSADGKWPHLDRTHLAMAAISAHHILLRRGTYQLPLVFARGVRTQAAPSCPSPVFPDGMNQPEQHVHVDIVEPACRETHYVLLFMLAVTRARPHGEAENPVLFLPVAGHRLTPR